MKHILLVSKTKKMMFCKLYIKGEFQILLYHLRSNHGTKSIVQRS